jgi:hypothetical protein
MSRLLFCIRVIACGLLSAGIVLAQPVSCNQASVVGTYGFTFEGTVLATSPTAALPALPRVGLALVSINQEGLISATFVQSIGGQFSQGPMAGTMTVKPDCTAAIDWGSGMTATAVVLKNGDEIHSMMLTGVPAWNPVIHGTWKRISHMPGELTSCSTASVVGTYSFRSSGSVMATPPGASQAVPVVMTMLGTGSIGYDGAFVSIGTGVAGKQVVPFESRGSFATAPDCTFSFTGTVAVNGVALASGAGWGVVLDGGNELWGISTADPMGAPVYWGTWTRISPIP